MKKEKEITHSYYVSIGGEEPVNMDDLTEEKRQEICKKLCRQYIENGLGGKVITA